MLATGHTALGYIIARIASYRTKEPINIPLVWALSLAPDIDFLLPGVVHLGPTHSVVLALLVFIPFFIWKRWKAVPYFLALVSHSILGDLVTNKAVMLLWPVSSRWVFLNVRWLFKWLLFRYYGSVIFVVYLFLLFITGDHIRILNGDRYDALLVFCFLAHASPLLMGVPIKVPPLLVISHVLNMGIMVNAAVHLYRDGVEPEYPIQVSIKDP